MTHEPNQFIDVLNGGIYDLFENDFHNRICGRLMAAGQLYGGWTALGEERFPGNLGSAIPEMIEHGYIERNERDRLQLTASMLERIATEYLI